MAVPEERAERQAASFKAFLLRSNGNGDRNLYDHLTDLLMKVMEERPENAVDEFEKMSLELKEDSLNITESTLRDLPDLSAAAELEQQRLLFSPPDDTHINEELEETVLSNVNETAFYLEESGVGLSRQEMQKIFLALRQLAEQEKPQHCRLWGKILGTESNYIVAETQHEEGVEQELSTEEQMEEEEMENMDKQEDPLPRSVYNLPPVVPKEAIGTGANKFIYYVCNKPGQAWVRLPSVSPAQITVARQINRFFTGRLDSLVLSYPPFPGNEANYLRAQIARISAGTQISPLGFYQLIKKEDDEEDETLLDNYEIKADFEGISATEMVEDMSYWVHHANHILPQGRCTWVNLAASLDTNLEEEENEEADEPEPEVGPPILTAVSLDAEMFDCPPWSSWLSTTLTPQHALAVLRSVLWPGAYACAHTKKFVNIYIGRGLKCVGEEYSPPLPPPPQKEYPLGSEVTENLDPLMEEEQALGLEEQQEALEGMEESEKDGEEEEEEEEEGEEYDDD